MFIVVLSVSNIVSGYNHRKCISLSSQKYWNQCWNDAKCQYEWKKRHVCEKNYIWNPATGSCENGKYLASIIDDSAIMCDEIIKVDTEAKSNDIAKSKNEETRTFNEISIKKYNVKNTKFLYFTCFFS